VTFLLRPCLSRRGYSGQGVVSTLQKEKQEMVEQRNTDSLEHTLEASVEAARRGDSAALEAVITAIQDRIYGLAMRMLAHPQDAQDATQEILVKIVTNLNTFRHEAPFPNWACRIAT